MRVAGITPTVSSRARRWLPITAASLALLSAGAPARAAPSEPANAPNARAQHVPSATPPRRGDPAPRRGFTACNPGSEPCTRSRPARLLLALTGLALGGAGAALFLTLGDSVGAGDPAGLMIGAGMTAIGGATLGSIFALVDHDRPTDADRLRPATLSLGYGLGPRPALGERTPGALRLRVAPTYWIAPGARVRLLAHVGGLAGTQAHVDPRPQLSDADGAFPTALRERRLDIGVALDSAIALPYPTLAPERSARLGGAELRWKPEAQIRRHTYNPQTPEEELLERVMLLPLTIGARWNVSSRQRFTVYAGPRFDFTSHRGSGSAQQTLRRGAPAAGPFYGEVWYELDVPFATRSGRTRVNGQLGLGYVHSRFDGRGLNLDAALGFLGPLHLRWAMRFRPPRARVAAQAGAGVILGNGAAVTLSLGVVLPDLGHQRAPTRVSAAASEATL